MNRYRFSHSYKKPEGHAMSAGKVFTKIKQNSYFTNTKDIVITREPYHKTNYAGEKPIYFCAIDDNGYEHENVPLHILEECFEPLQNT